LREDTYYYSPYCETDSDYQTSEHIYTNITVTLTVKYIQTNNIEKNGC